MSLTPFSYSVIDQSLPAPIEARILPANVDLKCNNCSVQGSFDVDAGLDDITIIIEGLTSNASIEVDLLPGFSAVDAFFAIFSRNITKDVGPASLDIELRIGIPLNVTLESTVKMAGGLLLDIPDLTLQLDLTSLEDSTLNGTDGIVLQTLPFGISAPDLAVNMSTGLAVQFSINGNIGSFDANVELEIGLPSVDIRFAELSNVNSVCSAAGSGQTSFAHALDVTIDAQARLEFSTDIDGVRNNFSTSDVSGIDLDFPFLQPQCVTGDQLQNSVRTLGGDVSKVSAGSRSFAKDWKSAFWIGILVALVFLQL